ncbi:hypothetical protein M5K25_020001 [Dendrobium thyrsiflorum]|uniref:Exonuclease domain-containing protein n=1 Tax=Dendrobium thyrsiflorum TaxID=117978 RepID=A0ABD0U8U0_DENTH
MEPARPNQQDDEKMIAFFDVETTVPSGSGRRGGGGGGYYLLEFGAILVCPRRLIEVDNFSTLVRPSDLNAISSLSIRCNGITRDSVSNAPYFIDVADKVFSFLHERIRRRTSTTIPVHSPLSVRPALLPLSLPLQWCDFPARSLNPQSSRNRACPVPHSAPDPNNLLQTIRRCHFVAAARSQYGLQHFA